MKILVINIALRRESLVKLFPVGLGYITTAMKCAGYNFDLLDIDAHRHSDVEVEYYIKKKKYDVICIGCIVTGYDIVKRLSSVVKKCHPNSIIIAGNSVATSVFNTLLNKSEVDIAVIGEGDITIVDLLNAIELNRDLESVDGIVFKRNNMLIQTKKRSSIKNISKLPFIDYSLWDIEIYIKNSPTHVYVSNSIPKEKLRALPVNTARGCIGKCSFCYHVFKEYPYRFRDSNSIIKEIRQLIERYQINYIIFWDELSFFSKKQTLQLVQAIIDSKLAFYWSGVCRADLFDSDEDIYIIEKMKESGCVSIGYSLESADQEILLSMNKEITPEQFTRQTALIQKVGIKTGTSLVLGFPQETPETIENTINCCVANKMYPSVGYLMPQPGSMMYEYAKEKGYIDDEECYLMKMGDRQDLIMNMTKMTNEQFESEVFKNLKRCNELLKIGLNDENLIKTQRKHIEIKSKSI